MFCFFQTNPFCVVVLFFLSCSKFKRAHNLAKVKFHMGEMTKQGFPDVTWLGDKLMHYKKIVKADEIFVGVPADYESAYRDSRKTCNWRRLDALSENDIKSKVIKFLNQWNCRLPSTHFNEIAEGIKQAAIGMKSFLDSIEKETLQDFNFALLRKVEGETMDGYECLQSIFDEFCSIGYKFRWVAASKTLHMVLPELFVMWDNPICEKLGLALSAESYAGTFLPLMKKEANEAINTYMQEHSNCIRQVAVDSIVEECKLITGYKKSLAKLVDEYNWLKYTKGHLL